MREKLKILIHSYYINGYGVPVKYYSDDDLATFVKNGIITQDEMDEFVTEKSATN